MSHALIDMLLGCDGVESVGLGELASITQPEDGTLGLLFLTGDPARLNETGDIAVILRELISIYPGRLRVGVVKEDEQRDVMRKAGVFALPSLSIFSESRCLETLPKVHDWPVYTEVLEKAFREQTTTGEMA